jgi:hypothetical protein
MPRLSLLQKTLFAVYGSLIGATYGWWGATYFQIDGPSKTALTIVGAIVIAILAVSLSIDAGHSPALKTFQKFLMILMAPFVFAAALFGVTFFFLMMCCLLPFLAFSGFLQERKFRRLMIEQGRYSRLKDLEQKLLQGEGTLLEETGANGVFRIWWTADVLEEAPASLSDKEFEALLFAETKDSFNARCLDVYLDGEKGIAVLTSIPARLANNGKLTQMFPKIKCAMIIRPMAPSQSERPGVSPA